MYRIYPTLLDSFFRYKGSVDYKEAAAAKEELINRINRVVEPEVEIVKKGKAFKKIIDNLCVQQEEGTNIDDMWSDEDDVYIEDNGYETEFQAGVLKHFVKKLAFSVKEYFTSAQIVVDNEIVELYGYVDNIRKDVVYDCKFVQKYDLAKYFSSQQRLVYPYCLEQNGMQCSQFEFIASDGRSVFSEVYNWNSFRDTQVLKRNIAEFINFLEKNRNFITDRKIITND